MLHLKAFGGLSLEIDGLPATGAAQQRKTLGLLALLAASGSRGLSRDKLIAALWPETDAEHGRGLLRQACYALRRDLHASELFLGSIQLRLNPAVISSDVGSFAGALEENDPKRAVTCYTAPFLDGFYLNGGGEFEDWAETERARLAGQYRAALELLSADATRQGEHRVATGWWRRLLELDPLSSHAALGLMTALDQAGEHAEALRSGEAYAERVRSELGGDPPAELSQWIEQHRHVRGKRVDLPAPTLPPEEVGGISRIDVTQPRLIRRVQRARLLGLAAVGAVVLLLGWMSYGMWQQQGTAPASATAVAGRKMLAVLPFDNRGPAADDYFADGLTEAIGLRLGGVRGLGVIASQSANQYKGTSKSLIQIGRELGVQYVLQGSVWWDKTTGTSRVRVSPTLIRVADGKQLWAAEYDTVMAGMFALQTSLATKVVGALNIALVNTERHRLEAPTANLEAYDVYLRGMEAAQRADDEPAERWRSLKLFQGAVALDSMFVAAYASLSITHVIMYLSYLDRDPDQLRRGKAALDRVMQLDPECDSGNCRALGFYDLFVLKDNAGALRAFTRAQEARPSDPILLSMIAHVYERLGQWSKAVAYERQGERLNPLDVRHAQSLAGLYGTLRDFPAANYYLDRALAQRPRSVAFRLHKALSYLNLTGDLKGARRFLPDVTENISPTGTHDIAISLSDIVLLLSDEQQTRLLQLTPAALAGDTAALALAKGLVHQHRHRRELARASFDAARVALQEKLRRHPDQDPFYHAMLGLALAGLQQGGEAVREGELAIALLPYPAGGTESALMPANLARIQVLLGHPEQAIDLLTTVLSRPGPLSAAWLRVDPFWDPLRNNPRFQRLAGTRN